MRLCLDCGDDISDRGNQSKRCQGCQRAAKTAKYLVWQRVNRALAPNRHVVNRAPKRCVPVLQPLDMTPTRVIEVEGEQYEVVFGGGEGLSSMGARGSTQDARRAVCRNGAFSMRVV